jgi:hypothetical protein
MTHNGSDKRTEYVGLLQDILLSIDLALLILVVHEGSMGARSWCWRTLNVYDSYRYPNVDLLT